MPDIPTPLDLDAILRRPEGDTMTSPITPDERAAVRKHAEVGHSLWPAEVLRLLDALDTAEAEVARLRAAHTHCDQEVYAETWNAGYENAMAQGLADDPVLADDWLVEHDERVRRAAEAERDEARAASARVHEAAARVVADEAAESDLTITRQRGRLRAREEQVRRLRAEVTRLHALVADLRATTAPAWDEDAVAEAVRRDLEAAGILPWTNGGARIVRTALAVVREHLPVKPSREDVVRALAVSDVHHPDFCDCGQPVCGGTCDVEGEDCFCAAERCDGLEQQINAALGLWPGRSEVEVKAEGLREAARAVENDERDGSPSVRELVGSTDRALSVEAWLRARADHLAAEGGDDRG